MSSDSALILQPARNPITRVEIARSFSYKINRGNYESTDLFCSQKSECAAEDAEAVSEALYHFCKSQVMKAVREHLAEQDQQIRTRRTA